MSYTRRRVKTRPRSGVGGKQSVESDYYNHGLESDRQFEANLSYEDDVDYGQLGLADSEHYAHMAIQNDDYGEGGSNFGGEADKFEHGVEDLGHYFRIKEHCYCTFCNEYFDDKAKFLVHGDCYFIRRQVDAINAGQKMTFPRGTKWTFACELCDKVTQVQTELRRHVAIHFPRSLACKSCSFRSATLANLKTHLKKVHKLNSV